MTATSPSTGHPRRASGVLPEDVSVDAQGHGRVGMAEAGGDNVDRDACQEQCGRVQVAQIMEAGVGSGCVGGVADVLCRGPGQECPTKRRTIGSGSRDWLRAPV